MYITVNKSTFYQNKTKQKNLANSTDNSIQYSVMTYMGIESKK